MAAEDLIAAAWALVLLGEAGPVLGKRPPVTANQVAIIEVAEDELL